LFLGGFGLLRGPAVTHYQQVLSATDEAAGNSAATSPVG
jgi:hypothetical protein